jgi:GTP cyclohydrolase III
MAWTMSSRVVQGPPKRIEFYIGAVLIAHIDWYNGKTFLNMGGAIDGYINTSTAMKEMHRRLNDMPDFLKQETL